MLNGNIKSAIPNAGRVVAERERMLELIVANSTSELGTYKH